MFVALFPFPCSFSRVIACISPGTVDEDVLKPVGWRHASLRVPRPSAKIPFQAPLHSPTSLYEHALELSRQEQYEEARAVFEDLLRQYPSMCKAWVSYAQMERRLGRIADPFHFHMARQILQKGLQLNPDSGCLAQAWGLLELQKGNLWAAIRLLERSVDMDPVLAPVLRWKPVHAASQHVRSLTNRPRGLSSNTNSSSNSRAVRTVCASSRAPAAQTGAGGAGQVLFVVFCTRGLAEEVVFRVMALPHPAVDGYTSSKDFAVRAMVSTAVFVAAHLLIPGQRQRQAYWDPRFLLMSTMFSALCSVMYYLTGSLLVIWLVHGVPVAIWLLLLGGAEKVQ
eukprot:gene2867-3159_t